MVSPNILATNNTVENVPEEENASKETSSHLVMDTGEAFPHWSPNPLAAVPGGRPSVLGWRRAEHQKTPLAV